MNFMMLYIPPEHDPLEQLDKHGLCESERRLASNVSDKEFKERYQGHPVMTINYNK